MTPGERWLPAMWPLVRSHLPAAPARVVDLGCGPLGGFVPMLSGGGYDAIGIDPQAPEEAHYIRSAFEAAEVPRPADAIVASTSLHHVADPQDVIGAIAATLSTGGTVVVLEWAWEKFDAETAEWCFERLGAANQPGWLHRRRDEWVASGQDWETFIRTWARRERLHSGETLLRTVGRTFRAPPPDAGPVFLLRSRRNERGRRAGSDRRCARPRYPYRLRRHETTLTASVAVLVVRSRRWYSDRPAGSPQRACPTRLGQVAARAGHTERLVTALGVVGLGSFAVVLGVVGWFLLKAAIEFDPSEPVGIGGRSPSSLTPATARGYSASRPRA